MAFVPNFRSGDQTRPGATARFDAVDAGLRAYMVGVFGWMAAGLAVTGAVAWAVAETSLRSVFYHVVPTMSGGLALRPTGLGYLAIFAPLVFVMVLSFGINRLSRQAVQTLFWVFCAVMGASMANILLVYTGVSIARTFFVTAGTFAAMALWGYTTRADLSRMGSFLLMGLFGLIIAGVVNIFLHSPEVQFIYSIVGVGIFTLLTGYDTQRIRVSYMQYLSYVGPEELAKRSVYDALGLYLNFINLFQFLMQFMGVRSNNNN